MIYRYNDLVSGEVITSDDVLLSNGLELIARIQQVETPSAEDSKARELADLPKLIGKRQKTMITDDPQQMWRYWNNARVARLVLVEDASPEVIKAFAAMLEENKLEFPDYYGGMTLRSFAESLVEMDNRFMLVGLELEAERIRHRRSITIL